MKAIIYYTKCVFIILFIFLGLVIAIYIQFIRLLLSMLSESMTNSILNKKGIK